MSVAWNDLEPLVEKQDTYDPDQEGKKIAMKKFSNMLSF